MKVILNADGVLNIIPENGTEVYALRHWKKSAKIPNTDPKYCEPFVYKESTLVIWEEAD